MTPLQAKRRKRIQNQNLAVTILEKLCLPLQSITKLILVLGRPYRMIYWLSASTTLLIKRTVIDTLYFRFVNNMCKEFLYLIMSTYDLNETTSSRILCCTFTFRTISLTKTSVSSWNTETHCAHCDFFLLSKPISVHLWWQTATRNYYFGQG